MIDYDLNLARINIIPTRWRSRQADREDSDIRIFDTGSLLGRGGRAARMAALVTLGLGDGLAAQLLSVSAFKPMIDKILTEAGFAAGPDALTSLTNALAAKQLAAPTNRPLPTVLHPANRIPPSSLRHARHPATVRWI